MQRIYITTTSCTTGSLRSRIVRPWCRIWQDFVSTVLFGFVTENRSPRRRMRGHHAQQLADVLCLAIPLRKIESVVHARNPGKPGLFLGISQGRIVCTCISKANLATIPPSRFASNLIYLCFDLVSGCACVTKHGNEVWFLTLILLVPLVPFVFLEPSAT